MAAVFAVFLVAVILAFARAEGGAHPVERLRALATGAVGTGRAILAKGTEIVELAPLSWLGSIAARPGLTGFLRLLAEAASMAPNAAQTSDPASLVLRFGARVDCDV